MRAERRSAKRNQLVRIPRDGGARWRKMEAPRVLTNKMAPPCRRMNEMADCWKILIRLPLRVTAPLQGHSSQGISTFKYFAAVYHLDRINCNTGSLKNIISSLFY
jgi:hypothetical protein